MITATGRKYALLRLIKVIADSQKIVNIPIYSNSLSFKSLIITYVIPIFICLVKLVFWMNRW